MRPTTFYMVSLGCAKNRVDSEVILGLLAESGLQYVDDPMEAGLIVVNTCAFIEPAVEESVDTILELAVAKVEGNCQLLVVVGCLPQRYGNKLARAMPEIDILVGAGCFHRLPQLLAAWQPGRQQVVVDRPRFLMTAATPRQLSGPRFSAYLKIADGCNNRCTFCTIPHLRGPLRSRPLEDLMAEARDLAAQGVRELNLVAQDTSAYGFDLGASPRLADLLLQLAEASLFAWIRVLYAHPEHLDERLLEAMGTAGSICPYLDIPLQHVSPSILARMGRQGSSAEYLRLLERIRRYLPGVALRSTLMVGFPGESEADFRELIDFVRQAEFQHLGVFTYSPEPGTAASRLGDPVPAAIKEQRAAEIAAVQESISLAHHRRLVGTTQKVLVEGPLPETDLLLGGRLATQAPEVDGRVLINRGTAMVGELMPARITAAYPHELVGEIVFDNGCDLR